MLDEPKCWTRKCKHFQGVLGEDEENHVLICDAFLDGIPDDIAYGNNLHLTPVEGQQNKIVYEAQ